jgi:hypothetical protein
VKQAVRVSRKFEPISKGSPIHGYRIDVEGLDGNQFDLVITLHWIYASNEPYKQQTQPILIGSHAAYAYYSCDLERSRVQGSRRVLRVVAEEDLSGLARLDLIAPPEPRKCTSIEEHGRWLNFGLTETCRPPFCTGSLFDARISQRSWQGTRHEWVWVPYDCYYHAYNRSDVLRCAEEKKISWIHVMGDSLSREHVGYLMTLFDNVDPTKFQHADIQLSEGEKSLRLTFHSWPDVINMKESTIYRDMNFTRTLLNHWNILQSGTSSPLEIVRQKISLPRKEDSRPDVFLMSPGTAYCLSHQTDDVSYPVHRDCCSSILCSHLGRMSKLSRR